MLVDCSDGKAVKMDPEAYPTGAVVRIIRRIGSGRFGKVSLGNSGEPLPYFKSSPWRVGPLPPRVTYSQDEVSLTDLPNTTLDDHIEDFGEARFIVSSLYRGGDETTTIWEPRELEVSLVNYPDGWVLMLFAEDGTEVQISLPRFDPRAKISMESLPGRPIWDRLNDPDDDDG